MTRYAELADLYRLGVPAASLPSTLSDADREAALDVRGAFVNSYLRAAGYQLPLAAWGSDLKLTNSVLTAYDLLSVRGFNPEADGNLLVRVEQQLEWLALVAKGLARPDGIVDASSGAKAGRRGIRPRVHSAATRGWSERGRDPTRGEPFTDD